jgi:hypothetical protein
MGRPKGSKNRRTLIREAEEALGQGKPDLDSLHILEEIMAHFYLEGMALKARGGKRDAARRYCCRKSATNSPPLRCSSKLRNFSRENSSNLFHFLERH